VPNTTKPPDANEELRRVLGRYREEGTVFLSGADGLRFRVRSLEADGCTVERLDTGEAARCTFALYAEKLAQVLEAGGACPFPSLDPSPAVRATVLQSEKLALSADRRTIHLVQDADQALDLLCDCLLRLRVDREDPPKLYKPALLACVFEAIRREELSANRIEFDWVVPRFLRKIKALGQTAGEAQAAYAFYHLTRELFWMLCYVDPLSPLHDTKRSPTAVRERVRHATLKDTFWRALQTEGAADRVLGFLSKRWFTERPAEAEGPTDGTEKSLRDLADRLLIDEGFLKTLADLLADKRQIILYGPPGTGKTFVAREVARHLAGSPERVEIVQFHPSYTYEDFVEGFRPVLVQHRPGFRLRQGPLRRLARAAGDGKPRCLVIDEINRGNVAKVFGELYFLLEYRDEAITLQYRPGKRFQLPKALFLIGTMNTADRSIALIDSALRRRFYFLPFFPDAPPVKGLLRRWLLKQGKGDLLWVPDLVDKANALLGTNRQGLIGPSYFMRQTLTADFFRLIWDHAVMPYLEEQFVGAEGQLEQFRLEKLSPERFGKPSDGGRADAPAGTA
jgi:hypothetical protein